MDKEQLAKHYNSREGSCYIKTTIRDLVESTFIAGYEAAESTIEQERIKAIEIAVIKSLEIVQIEIAAITGNDDFNIAIMNCYPQIVPPERQITPFEQLLKTLQNDRAR